MSSHFTFFASYYDSVEHLDAEIKAEFFDVLFKYALRDEEPAADTSHFVLALFTMAKPNLDKSKARREAGEKGGSKTKQTGSKTEAKEKQSRSKAEAKQKQTGSKPEANTKQVLSDKEKEKEKDKDKEFNRGVFFDEEFQRIKKYRSIIGKPFKTQAAVTGLSNSFGQCYKKGYTFEQLFNLMEEKQWTTIKLEWVEKEIKISAPRKQEVCL